MASFGAFEVVREVYSGLAYSVFSARKPGDEKTEYAVKVFSVQQLGLDAGSTAELDQVLKDLERSCVERISIQQKAAAASQFICPVLERGQDERGVWYATGFYPRSINKIISGRVALNLQSLWHLLYSVARGALDLKKTCGRSHGDIQASAVQISRSDKLASAQVVLSDPLPGGPEEAIRYELSDLVSIGRILLQLVLQREITQPEDFTVLLPIVASPEWQRLFDDKAERWVALCNLLLDPDLTLGQITLERLVQELEQLQLKPRISTRQLAMIGGAALFVLLVSILVIAHYKRGTLIVKTDPPGAEILIKPEGGGEYKSVGKTFTDNQGLVLKRLPKGRYSLQAKYSGLADQVNAVTVEGGKSRPYIFVFPYGLVKLTSSPDAAVVELEGKPVGTTPYSSSFLPPGQQQSYTLRLTNYQPAKVAVVVPGKGQPLAVHTNLIRLEAGTAVMEFTSRPDNVKISENGVELCTTPGFKTLKIGRHQITAQFEDWPPTNLTIEVVAGENPAREIYLPHGQANFSITPSDALVTLNDRSVGRGLRAKPLRPGEYSVKVEHEGYYSATNKPLTIREGQVTPFTIALAPMLGFVEFTSEPPGATVFEVKTANPLGNTREGQPLKHNFQPGKYTFYARFDELGLDPVTNKEVSVAMGASLSQVMAFNHAAVQFETDPAGAQVSISGQSVKPTPYVHYQKPGPISYHIELPDYYPIDGRTNLQSKEKLQVSVPLRRKDVALLLKSDPPGAFFFMEGARLTSTNSDRYLVPWGAHTLVARYPGPAALPELDPITNTVQVDKNGGTQITVPFKYAMLEITNDEPEARLLYQTKPVTNLPVKLLLKPDMQYDFVLDGGPEFRSNLPPVKLAASQRLVPRLVLPDLRRSFKNTLLGLKFEWVPGLAGGGDWGDGRHTNGGWVAVYEVAQAQFEKVMKTNPSVFKCPDVNVYPVENLKFEDALEFCRRLPPEVVKGKSWQYRLPSDQQYEFFAADADTAGKVTSQGLPKKREHPEQVGTGKPNKYKLFDLVGNVAEWMDSPVDPITKGHCYRGGSYWSVSAYKASTASSAREANKDNDPTVGFRIVLVPAAP